MALLLTLPMFELCILPPQDYFKTHFFNTQAFIAYQCHFLKKKALTLGVRKKTTQELQAALTLTSSDEKIWTSPVTGAFGGPILTGRPSFEALDFFIEHLGDFLKSYFPLQALHLKLPPPCYPDGSSIVANILYRHRWSLSTFDVNYHWTLTSLPAFISNLSGTKRKILNRLGRMELLFKTLPLAQLPEVYDVIQKNREAQGYPLTMTQEALADLARHFPDKVKLFGVCHPPQSHFLATAICLTLHPHALYVFYWGELPETRELSPVLFLAKGLIQHALEHHISLLDIGISSFQSTLNEGLCIFKESLGCQATPKLTFSKEIAL